MALANPKADIETIYSLPNCTLKHEREFLYNYDKSYKDPIEQRPGVCWTMTVDQETGNPVREETGKKQSPINLDTTQPVTTEFKDDVFEVLFMDALTETENREARLSTYAQLDSIVHSSMPVIPLFHDEVTHILSDKVQGWRIHPVNRLDLRRVSKE